MCNLTTTVVGLLYKSPVPFDAGKHALLLTQRTMAQLEAKPRPIILVSFFFFVFLVKTLKFEMSLYGLSVCKIWNHLITGGRNDKNANKNKAWKKTKNKKNLK